jgi:N-acetylneuraminic acid mutarotase
VLLGGENTSSQLRDNLRFEDVSLVDDAWVFDTRSHSWGRVEMNAHNFRFRSMASCISYNSKLYLFGGLHNYNTVLKDLVAITIDQAELEDPKRF